MDPRHPELAIERIDELVAQYKDLLSKMRICNISSQIAGMERECGLVIQEICLVAPRLHEAMMQVSRTRRAALARGIVVEDVKKTEEKVDIPEPDVNEKPKKRGRKKKAE